MKRKNRLIILSFCTFLFLLMAPLILLYSQGYRFDFDKNKIVKTGGIFIEVSNTSAEIYINEKFVDQTGFFANTVLIENLLPKKYNIEVRQTEFQTWQKNLEIKEKQVTKVENILLVKQNILFDVLEQNIEEFLVSEDEKKILLKRTEQESWILEELIFDGQTKQTILEQKDLTELGVLLIDITQSKWDSEKNRILIKTKDPKENIFYFLLDYNSEKPTLSKVNFPDKGTENISFNPNNINEIFYLKDQVIFKKDLKLEQDEPRIFLNNIITFKATKDYIIWLSTSGFIFRNDYISETKEVLNQKPFLIEPEKKYEIESQGSRIFLLEDNVIYYVSSAEDFEKILDNVQGIKVSSDSRKAVCWNNYEIWILEFEPSYKKIFLNRFSETIGDCLWFNYNYLAFNLGNKIRISETDTRDKINIFSIKELKNPKIFYNNSLESLYIFSENNLFFSTSIIK